MKLEPRTLRPRAQLGIYLWLLLSIFLATYLGLQTVFAADRIPAGTYDHRGTVGSLDWSVSGDTRIETRSLDRFRIEWDGAVVQKVTLSSGILELYHTTSPIRPYPLGDLQYFDLPGLSDRTCIMTLSLVYCRGDLHVADSNGMDVIHRYDRGHIPTSLEADSATFWAWTRSTR